MDRSNKIAIFKKVLTLLFSIFFVVSSSYAANRYWIAAAASNWNNTANWSTASGGLGGASVPVAGDFVFFDANGAGNCTLDIAANFDGINTTGYAGIIDLAGFAFDPAVGGAANCTFAAGTINDTPASSSVTFTTSGTTYFSGTVFGAIVNATSGRVYLNGSTFNAVSSFSKTGAGSDASTGGNTFVGNCSISNSGTGYFLLGNGSMDDFQANLDVVNTGSHNIYVAYNSAGNLIGGHLTTTNFATGAGSYGIYISSLSASTLTITGNVNMNQNGNGTTLYTYLGDQGDVTVNGTVTLTNAGTGTTSDMRIANNTTSLVTIAGTTTLNNNGASTTKRIYAGNVGDIIFNGTVDITNNSSATNSQVFMNYSTGASNTYNENITVQSTNTSSDGIFFGSNGGSGTLAATKTITIPGIDTVNYVGGDLYFRNFTQTGATDHSFELASTALYIYNYDCSWGGNVDFRSPRAYSRGTTYNGTTRIEKTGGIGADAGAGGNTFVGDVTIANSGSQYLMFGNGTMDDFQANVDVINTGTNHIYLAHNGPGHTIGGNLTVTNSATGPSCVIYVGTGATVTLAITGDVSLSQDGTGNTLTTYFGDQGDITVGGNVTLTNAGTGTTSDMRIANNANSLVGITGNLTVTNSAVGGTTHNTYIGNVGDINVGGNLIVDNLSSGTTGQVLVGQSNGSVITVTGNATITNNGSGTTQNIYAPNQGIFTVGGKLNLDNSSAATTGQILIGWNTTSSATITDSTIVSNSGAGTTKRVYLGYLGDITFNGALDITNSSSATNSQIYLNSNPGSVNAYNENITVKSTNTSSDGILFGSSGGSGTLAATKTITIPGIDTVNFVGGDLHFRNFTQTGATNHSFELASTCTYIYNYDSNWGGDVDFRSPRAYTRGTTYSGTARIEKTGGIGDDAGAGGNTFVGDATLVNSGSRYLMFGNGTLEDFQSNVTVINSGTYHFYLAYNGLGHNIGGNLSITNSATGNSCSVLIGSLAGASLNVVGDVTINQNGSGNALYTYLGDQGDVTIGGNVTMTNAGTGTTSDMRIAQNTNSLVAITGNLEVTSSAVGGTNQNNYIANVGDITVGGKLSINNSSSATNGHMYVAWSNGSVITVTGATTVTNAGAGTTKRIYLGNSGDITFNGTLDITNNSTATNSEIYLNHGTTSVNAYNDNITVQSTTTSTDGIFFGLGAGSGTLAATKTITIPGIDTVNFQGGQLYFRNFTQTGATDHAFELASTCTYIYNYDSNWGGNVDFRSPRAYTRGTTYSGTARIEKTGGIGADQGPGGNTFVGDATLVNSGSQYLMFGNGTVDDFQANVDVINSGTNSFYLAHNGAGHTIGGNLSLTNSASGTSCLIYVAAGAAVTLGITGDVTMTQNGSGTTLTTYLGDQGDVTVGGNVTLINAATGTTSDMRIANNTNSLVAITGNLDVTNSATGLTTQNTYLGNQGDITIGGTLDIDNSSSATTGQILMAYNTNSSITVANAATASNSGAGTTKRVYLGHIGDIIFNGTLDITNSATATNSEFYLNNNTGSINAYNENITVQCTNTACDGIFFGLSNGSGTLAATKTITIPGIDTVNYVGGQLYFRNFTQTGPTDHSFELASTCTYVYNYDSNWGGNVDFRSPRHYSRGTTYGGTSYLEKTGGIGDDAGAGGNTFVGDATLVNSGSRYLMFGNGTMDDFQANVTVINSGTYRFYLAHTGLGHSIGGNLTVTNSGSGAAAQVYISAGGSLDITGNVSLTQNGPSTASYTVFGDQGDITVGGNVTLTNAATGATSDMRIANNTNSLVDITGNLDVTNSATGGTTHTTYLGNVGDITIGGTLDIDNSSSATTGQVYMANNAASTITVANAATVSNSGAGTTKRIYLGNSGDVTFNGTLDLTNNSSATNSELYLNAAATSSNLYNENITVTTTHTSCDGIFFGVSGGTGVLAATKTVTIPGVDVTNYVGGQLYFRNFTQTGATDHAFELASTASYIYNYDSNWGGNVNFKSPRHYSRGTTYNGTAYLEKTGGIGDDAGAGGNTFVGNATLVNSGSRYLMFGNGTMDDFQANLDVINSGTYHFYLAYNGAGHNVAGDLTITNSATGPSCSVLIGSATSATLNVDGNVTITQNGTGTALATYFGDQGDITVGGNVTLVNAGTGNSTDTRIAHNTNSLVDITGNLDVTNSAVGGSTQNTYVGNQGDINIGGTLDLDNSSTATTGQILLAWNTNSSITVTNATTVTNSGAGTTKRTYLGHIGDVAFNGTLDITNNSSATNSQVYLNNNTGSVNTYNENITIQSTHTSCDGILFGAAGGSGTLAATKTITIPGVDATNFIGGQLYFRNFTQTGATAQSFDLAPTTLYIYNYDSNWGGDVDFRAPRHYTLGTTYNGTAYLEKNGATNDASNGGNTFNGDVTFQVTGTGYFMPANVTPNDFNANVTYVKTGSGPMYPTYNTSSTYAGNITVNSAATMYFGAAGNGRVELDGTAAQSINVVGGTPAPQFRDLQTSNPNDDITLNTPITIITELDLDQGHLISTSINLITMNNGSSLSSASEAAFVDGPIRKIGNQAFTFPTGKNDTAYAPVGISAPSNSGHHFTAEYFQGDPHIPGFDRTSREVTLDHVSGCEYWILDRTNGGSNVDVTLSWDDRSCGVTNLAELSVAQWDGAQWTDEGNDGAPTGSTLSGTVTSSAPVANFGTFTLASVTSANPLPIDLISFDAEINGDQVDLFWQTQSEKNNERFYLEKSANGVDGWISFAEQPGAGAESYGILNYEDVDYNPYSGVSYYRLKQKDFDGNTTYSYIVAVYFSDEDISINLFPNPSRQGENVFLTFDGEIKSDVQITLKDMRGREVYSETIQNGNETNLIKIPLNASLLPGIYLVNISSSDTKYSEKLIIK